MCDFMSLWEPTDEKVIAHIPTVSFDETMDETESIEDVVIEGVLFGVPTPEDIATAERMHGKRVQYKLCVPESCTAMLDGATITREMDESVWTVIVDGPALPVSFGPNDWNREVLLAREDG